MSAPSQHRSCENLLDNISRFCVDLLFKTCVRLIDQKRRAQTVRYIEADLIIPRVVSMPLWSNEAEWSVEKGRFGQRF